MTKVTASFDKLTPEQIDFLQAQMPLGNIKLKSFIDENGVSYNELLQRVQQNYPYFHSTPDIMILNAGKLFIENDYPSMSDKEQVNFLHSQLIRSDNPVVQHYAYSINVNECNNVADLQKKFNELCRQNKGFNYLNNLDYIPSRPSKSEMEREATQGEAIFGIMCMSARCFANYPPTPEPEPEVELEAPAPAPKPRGMATTSKDKRVRIDQWMAHIGKSSEDAQALVDKYGIEVAHAICQQAFIGPANLKDVTDGKSMNTKNAIQYFLDNEVSADKLATIPGLDAEKVEASLQSVRPEPKVEQREAITLDEPISLSDVELKTPQPTAEQVSLDQQKVLFATLLKKDLQLASIPQDRVDLAIDMAFARSLEGDAANFEEWAFNFRQDLVQNLGGEKAFANKEADYNQLCATFADAKTAVVTGNVPDDISAHTATFESMVVRNNLHMDLAGMEPSTPILTSEMYRQTVRFNKAMERQEKREERKGQRDERRAEELGITVEELHQRRDERKEKWSNFVDQINPFKGREQ